MPNIYVYQGGGSSVAACGVGITFGYKSTNNAGTKVQIMTLLLLLLQALSAGGPPETSRLVFVVDILVTVDKPPRVRR
jgi:hypothetical protein